MTKATIRTKSGIEVTVEGDKGTIAEIFSLIQKREELKDRFKEFSILRRNELAHGHEPLNLPEKILKLGCEGFFKERRTLSDIQKKLEESGHIYPTTTLSAIVLNLVRRGQLSRLKAGKNWVYINK
jgi:hypothetical protein